MIVYKTACEEMLRCYFNDEAPPSYFELALVGYSFSEPWGIEPHLSEVRPVDNYMRVRVVIEEAYSFAAESDPGVQLVRFVSQAPAQFIISSELQTVETSNDILGWALLKDGSPSQPFSNSNALVCAGSFAAPITKTTTKLVFVFNPLRITMGSKGPVGGVSYAYPEITVYKALAYRVLRKYFGDTAVATPELEICIINSFLTETDSMTARRLVETVAVVNGVTAPVRTPVVGPGTVSTPEGGLPQITWPSVTVTCGGGTSIIGYAIVIKSSEPAVSILTDASTLTGKILAFSPFPDPITAPPSGFQIDITPTIALSNDTFT